jgi:hypothetical protein
MQLPQDTAVLQESFSGVAVRWAERRLSQFNGATGEWLGRLGVAANPLGNRHVQQRRYEFGMPRTE